MSQTCPKCLGRGFVSSSRSNIPCPDCAGRRDHRYPDGSKPAWLRELDGQVAVPARNPDANLTIKKSTFPESFVWY